MDNQLIFWYPYMRARGKALILTTHKHCAFYPSGLFDGVRAWGLRCGPSDGVTQGGSHATYWIVGVSVQAE